MATQVRIDNVQFAFTTNKNFIDPAGHGTAYQCLAHVDGLAGTASGTAKSYSLFKKLGSAVNLTQSYFDISIPGGASLIHLGKICAPIFDGLILGYAVHSVKETVDAMAKATANFNQENTIKLIHNGIDLATTTAYATMTLGIAVISPFGMTIVALLELTYEVGDLLYTYGELKEWNQFSNAHIASDLFSAEQKTALQQRHRALLLDVGKSFTKLAAASAQTYAVCTGVALGPVALVAIGGLGLASGAFGVAGVFTRNASPFTYKVTVQAAV